MTVKIAFAVLAYTLVKVIDTSSMEGFIVGGNYSAIEDFPYSVYVSKNCSNRNSSCGASILTQELLLSAAHCYFKCHVPYSINAYTGAVEKFHGAESKVVDFRVHEEYSPVTHVNDIALLKLEFALMFANAVKRVAVMKTPPEAKEALVAGWGWVDSKGTRGSHLKHAHQLLIDHEACAEILYYAAFSKGIICGREKDGVSYPEKGDSGSALVIHNFIQIGLVSFKMRQYTNDTVVYTYVPYYYDWIKEKAAELLCSHSKDTNSDQQMNSTSTPQINCLFHTYYIKK